MKITLHDALHYYDMDAVCYSVEVYQSQSAPLSVADYLQITDIVRYYSKKDGVSFMTVYSTTESDNAMRIAIRTGKRGRPKTIVDGTKTSGHIHCSIVGNKEKSASKTARTVKERLDKKFNRKICRVVSKGNGEHAFNWISYSLRQADIKRTGGDFDFQKYVDEHNFFRKT